MRCRRLWYVGVILCGIWASGASVAWGQSTVVVDFSTARETVPKDWELSVHTGEPHLQLVQDDGKQALRMRSDQASFALQKKIRIALLRLVEVGTRTREHLPEGFTVLVCNMDLNGVASHVNLVVLHARILAHAIFNDLAFLIGDDLRRNAA